MSDEKKTKQHPPFDLAEELKKRTRPADTKHEREAKAHIARLTAEFLAMSDEERLRRVIDLDLLSRNAVSSLVSQRKHYEERMTRESSGRAVPAVHAFAYERLNRDNGLLGGRVARLELALETALKPDVSEEELSQARRILEEKPPRPRPTPPQKLGAFKPEPAKLTAHDLVLAAEEAYGAPCPGALAGLFEHAARVGISPNAPKEENSDA